ncbi:MULTISPECIES: helix-turn-helix domain-containing protein [Comamonas]|uniref:helix-turn-helix domain-containing protein n=1 Tax=Comamonas TaxID=283 RepID=UPI0012AD3B05|nr:MULTISPECIES: helix-turn-helix transcriptional regulator [Comamonas]MDE1557369.1 helix-turn-helix transcriptional regulator [Comamonas aquatica]MDH0383714.1 helix-turn-helix domain-containing protein [Comamonas aquatica]MDH0431683.1 helix-turn-helix domain-containing protein [Comamonas aquatica]MDH0942800.1 helix-turn-helix domain-containing protein [Comamonas aquatica]MRT18799.1 helix-turn-helix transcriptional regulator [Comamonas sp. CAH-2]
MNESASTIGDRITQARMARGWSQTDLGRACDMAPTQVSRYESGRAAPRRQTILKIAQALAVEYQWLTSGVGAMDQYGPGAGHPGMKLWIDGDLALRIQTYAAHAGLTIEEAFIKMLDFTLSGYEPAGNIAVSPEHQHGSAADKMRYATLSKKVKVL